MDTIEHGKILLVQARNAIASHLGLEKPLAAEALPWLLQPGATFVTLTQQGQLRGCIGSLEAYRPLLDDVRHNAVAAAFHDSRFTPLTQQELALILVEVSLLSPHKTLNFINENDALAQLRPGIDGVILQWGRLRSTFLPQVWEQLPTPEQFMAHLKRKAGLSEQFWTDEIKLSRYTVSQWKEQDPHGNY